MDHGSTLVKYYSKNIILLPLTDVADAMLTQSGEEVDHVRSKGHVSCVRVIAYVMVWGCLFQFKVDAFRKEYNNISFIGNDLERRLYDTSVS